MKQQFQAFSYKVENKADDSLDVFIDGIIVDADTQQILKDWFGDETSVSYKSFRDQVTKAAPKVLNLFVNSGGGMVSDAMAIHDFMSDLESKGTIINRKVRGIAASAATYLVIGNNSEMSENSWLMIHNVSGGVYGDVNMIENYAKVTRKFNDSIVKYYSNATGLSETVISNMMDNETWMTAAEAKEKGFIKNVTGKTNFSNVIAPEQWPYSNKAVLNVYNSNVKSDDKRTFFSDLKNDFMSFFNDLKAGIGLAKADAKFENVAGRDAVLDMVESILTPLVNKMDEALKPAEVVAPANQAEAVTVVPVAAAVITDTVSEIDQLKNELAEVKLALANASTKPKVEAGPAKNAVDAKIEFEN